jgi:D-alanyl-D-alanine carboxypeptidase/D-alanyl-D-alanine-endopeptidase (penicillin-binding protein 4)
MKKKLASCSISMAIILISCSTTYKITKSAKSIILENDAFASAHTGISIYEPATGKYWYNYQAEKYFVPASNTKLFTCYAAMKYLSDSLMSFKYNETRDTLYIIPLGDPTFLGKEFTTQAAFDFLKYVHKPLVINNSMWDEKRWGSGWSWDDYNDDYAAERSVMPMYENLATFSNVSNHIKVSPSFFSDKIFHKSSVADKQTYHLIQRDISSNTFIVSGNDSLRNTIDIPFYTANDSTLINLLEDTLHEFVRVDHSSIDEHEKSWPGFHSQPTDSLLKIMMHRSDNFFAEQSLLMVSARLSGIMNDEKIIDTLLKTDYEDLPQKPNWVDGSGLSHYNLFSPKDFVMLLNKMKETFGMPRIKSILATGGTGTLANYYKDDAGYIYAKTGSLSGVVALSGFLYSKKNRLLIFSILLNNHHGNGIVIRKAIEKFIENIRNKY